MTYYNTDNQNKHRVDAILAGHGGDSRAAIATLAGDLDRVLDEVDRLRGALRRANENSAFGFSWGRKPSIIPPVA